MVGNHLCLAGPMVDGYLQPIGKAINNKLGRETTGLAPAIKLYIPWEVAQHVFQIFQGYGAEFHEVKKNKMRRLVLWVNEDAIARKIFNPKRFDGTYFLSKRIYKKDESGKLQLSSIAKVVVSKGTPIQVDYYFDSSTISMNFYIQHYTSDGIAVDSSVQDLINMDITRKEAEEHFRVENMVLEN